MKKIIFVLVLVFASVFASAQAKQGDVNFGVTGGANLSNFKGEGTDNVDYGSRTALMAGALMRYHITQMLGLQIALAYGGHGAEYQSAKYKFSSLFLPIMATYFISSFYLQTGPQLGFLLGAKQEFNGNEHDIKDSYRSLHFAWLLGLGYMITQNLGLEARYNFGIGSMLEDGNHPSISNSIFTIGLVYLLSVKK